MEKILQQDEQETSAENLFKELLEVVTDTFIATYEVEGNSMVMKIVCGKKFRISVEELN